MRKLNLLITTFLILLSISNISHAQGKMKIAVLYFKDTSISGNYSRFVEGLPDMLMTDLGKSSRITIIERVQIDKAFENFKIEKSKYFDKTTAVKIGKWVGAEAVVLGNFSSIGESVRIDARVLDIKTGELLESAKVQGKVNEIYDLVDKLASKILVTFTGETISFKSPKKIVLDKIFTIKFPSKRKLLDTSVYLRQIKKEEIYRYKSDDDNYWFTIERIIDKWIGSRGKYEKEFEVTSISSFYLILRCKEDFEGEKVFYFHYEWGEEYFQSQCGIFKAEIQLIESKNSRARGYLGGWYESLGYVKIHIKILRTDV